MKEYFTEAIVLDKEERGEFDARVHFYTKELGRVTAKATSARKITSKLNSHLEPLNLIQLQLVHKNNFQIIDALEINRFTNWRKSVKLAQVLDMLRFIKEMTLEGESDYELWTTIKNLLYSLAINYRPLLRVLGFDPQLALCEDCQRKPDFFFIQDLSFYCRQCYPKLDRKLDFLVKI